MSRKAPKEPASKSDAVFDFIEARIRKRGKPPSRKEIAEELGVTPSRVTAILNELVRKERIILDGSVSWLTLPGYSLKKS